MKISVITISFNSAAFIERNLKSVNEQTWSDVEHVFVDNVSTDQTGPLIQSISKRDKKLISEKDRGISDAFNKGIRAASGDVIAILNSDDTFYSQDTLERVAQAFDENPDVDFVFGDMYFIDPDYGSNIRRPLLCPITHAMPYNHPAFFVRKSFYETLGLYDETFRYAMDFELISRMYTDPTHTRLKGLYLAGEPLAIMYAGGASWKFELNALDDVKKALQKNGLWNSEAEAEIRKRKKRTELKYTLAKWKLNFIVKLWRNLKWKKVQSS
jgi:glycosyltransferase involved in cell wall biosynthesis